MVASGSAISYNTNQVRFLAVCASTVHFIIDELPSKPGVNWISAEKASMFDKANADGGCGSTGSIPLCIKAVFGTPEPIL